MLRLFCAGKYQQLNTAGFSKLNFLALSPYECTTPSTHARTHTHTHIHAGVINLSECSKIVHRESIKGHKFVFDVCTHDRVYHLAAESIEEKQQWIGTLNRVLSTGLMVCQSHASTEGHMLALRVTC